MEANCFNDISETARLRQCDGIAMLAAVIGVAVRQLDPTRFVPSGPALFLLGIAWMLACSLAILGGYAYAQAKTNLPWSKIIHVSNCKLIIRIITIAGLGALLAVGVSAVNFGMRQLLPSEGCFNLVQYIKESDGLVRIRLLLSVVVCAPIFEEFFFRLALPRWLQGWKVSAPSAAVVSALLFALSHGIWWGIPGLFLFGLALSYLCKKQDILSCCCVHSVYNLLVAMLALQ